MVRNFVYPAPYAAVPPDSREAQGLRVKYWREQKGWTQAQLAKRVGLKPSSVGTIEQGGQKNSKGLVKLAAVLGVDYTHLTTGEGDPHTDVQVIEVIADGSLPFPPELIARLNRLHPNDRRLAALELEKILADIESARGERSKQA